MSIASYSDMQSLIARRLHRSDLSSYIVDYITLAEARIYREMRVRQMETSFSSAISSGTISLPTGYLELKHAYLNTSPIAKLQRKDSEWIYAAYPTRSADSAPKFIARDGSTFIFGPYPDTSYTVAGIYFKKLDALSGSNTTNWLITDAPDLLLYASLVEAATDLVQDQRVVLWEQKYQQAKREVERQNDSEDVSGSPLQVTGR